MAAPRQKPLGKRIKYWLEARLLFAVLAYARSMDMDRASRTGAAFGRKLLMPLLGRGANALSNTHIAFPELPEEARRQIIAGMWENIGRILFEMPHVVDLLGPEGDKRLTFKGIEHVEAARARGKGVLLLTGHFGNWEVSAPAMKRAGIPGYAVTRPPNNPEVARYIGKLRADGGAPNQISKGAEGLKQIFTALRRGEVVALLVDQHLSEGIAAPFFGRPAMTTHAPASLARKLGSAIVFYALRRTEGAHFEVEFYPELVQPPTDNAEADVLAMTAQINRMVEREVRAAPTQWLWMHNRWKMGGRKSAGA